MSAVHSRTLRHWRVGLAALLATACGMMQSGAARAAAADHPLGGVAKQGPAEGPAEGPAYIHWLEERSMLEQARTLARSYSGNSIQWQHAYGEPRPRAAVELASVWFTAYAASTIPSAPGVSSLATLGDERLWRAFQRIGIQGVHTGPVKLSGGISGYTYTPTVDGHFDRISFEIDPALGTEAQYKALVATAHRHGAVVIGDIIPGHTGKGADWLLAERAYEEYPGLYHMVEIPPADWALLPPVPAGRDAVNLSPATVEALTARRYIVGNLHSGIFYTAGVKDTDWSATGIVQGVDGSKRRWVYLHLFKQGQPTLNWLDPSFAAQRLVIGDEVHEIGVLGDAMVRLDANGLLGIERRPDGTVWFAGHPLSVTANQLIADMARKIGGFTWEELALPLDVMREMSSGGPDLSYDFVTRPAYDHALLTGDAEFLRLIYRLMRQYDIDPGRLIHALQNHDELTMGLAPLTATHASELFPYHGRTMTGRELRDLVRSQMYERLIGERAPYNLKFGEGVASTTVSLLAAKIGIRDLSRITPEQKQRIAKLHLLLAFFNAMQPGVFALSGWDLMGDLTLPAAVVRERLADGDTRWINRGAYDLLGTNPGAQRSPEGLPRAVSLYGPLPQQLDRPDSFASRLARMLRARAQLHLYAARLVDVPSVRATGLFVLVHELPEGAGREITAINFGDRSVDEAVRVRGAAAGSTFTDALDPSAPALEIGTGGTLRLRLKPYETRALVFKG
jgi:trehalose synthase